MTLKERNFVFWLVKDIFPSSRNEFNTESWKI